MSQDLDRLLVRERIGDGRDFGPAADRLLSWDLHRAAGLGVDAASPVPAPGERPVLRLGPVFAPIQVTSAVRDDRTASLTYEALLGHPERGWERFTVERREDGTWIEIEAHSRPATWWSRLGGPITYAIQRWVTRRYVSAAKGHR